MLRKPKVLNSLQLSLLPNLEDIVIIVSPVRLIKSGEPKVIWLLVVTCFFVTTKTLFTRVLRDILLPKES
jgi:hypothetical protein